MLTSKEIGGSLPVYDFDVEHSALLEAGYSSSSAVADKATIAVCFKPTNVDAACPLCDPTNHYLLLITKDGANVAVGRSGTPVGSYTSSAATYAGLLSEALTQYAGTDHGYYSNLYVVENVNLSWGTFFELSDKAAGLWMCRESPAWKAPGPNVFSGGTITSNLVSPYGLDGDTLFDGLLDRSHAWYPSSSYADTVRPEVVYDLGGGVARRVEFYRMTAGSRTDASGYPRDWTIYGSNDALTWDVLDQVAGVTAQWRPGAAIEFAVASPGDYRYHKLTVTYANDPGGARTVLNMLALWQGFEGLVNDYGPGGGRYAFLDGAALGADSSGNGNHWSVAGAQSRDTPTNNHPVLNPLFQTAHALADGNLSFTGDEANNITPATMECFDGCYWEMEWFGASGGGVGVADLEGYVSGVPASASWLAGNEDVVRFDNTHTIFPVNILAAGVIGLAYMNGKLWYSWNGQWDGDPAAGTGAADESISGTVYPFWLDRYTTNVPTGRFRFSRADLVHAPPAGFRPLNARNAAMASVLNSSEFADVVLRTGTGGEAAVTGLGFQPGFVSAKSRTSSGDWHLFDGVRGATRNLSLNTADPEATLPDALTAFLGDGYALGSRAGTNRSGEGFVDLCLKADRRAGFGIVAYTGDGTAGRQVGHGLGKVPTFMIVKRLDSASDWAVYHRALGPGKALALTTDTSVATANFWYNTEPTATHFSLGPAYRTNADGGSYVAYLFTDSDVFRAFSYRGNGLVNGPCVGLGGRALSVPFLKNGDAALPWTNQDAVRGGCNPSVMRLVPDTAAAETTDGGIVFTSAGMKITSAAPELNGAGNLHVGLAVLARTSKYSNGF